MYIRDILWWVVFRLKIEGTQYSKVEDT